MPDTQEKLSTLQEVAARFKVSEKTVRRWFHSRQLEAIEAGRQLRFEEKEIKRFMDLRRRARVKRTTEK
jgi:excisionase family DNA binding protein